MHESEVDEPLSEQAVQEGLPATSFGCELRCLNIVGSTNDTAREWAKAGVPEGAVVTAEEQAAGRGREGRPWHCPRGKGLLFSVVLRPSCPAREAGCIAAVMSIGAANAIITHTALPVRVKPPNDIMLHGRKLGGILVESQLQGERVVYAVAGLGINVNGSADDFPAELCDQVITIETALGRPLQRAPLLRRLLEDLESAWATLASAGWVGLGQRWEELIAGEFDGRTL